MGGCHFLRRAFIEGAGPSCRVARDGRGRARADDIWRAGASGRASPVVEGHAVVESHICASCRVVPHGRARISGGFDENAGISGLSSAVINSHAVV